MKYKSEKIVFKFKNELFFINEIEELHHLFKKILKLNIEKLDEDKKLNNKKKDMESLIFKNIKTDDKTRTIIKKIKKFAEAYIREYKYSDGISQTEYQCFKLACSLNEFPLPPSSVFYNINNKNISDNDRKYLKDSSILQKVLFLYNKDNEIQENINKIYITSTIPELISACTLEVLKHQKIKKCKNCKNLFITSNKNAQYCEENSPQNKNFSCRVYCTNLKFKNLKQEDEAFEIEQRIKKRLKTNIYRNSYSDKEKIQIKRDEYEKTYIEINEKIKNWKTDIKCGKISKKKYLELLKKEDEKTKSKKNSRTKIS